MSFAKLGLAYFSFMFGIIVTMVVFGFKLGEFGTSNPNIMLGIELFIVMIVTGIGLGVCWNETE